MYGVARKRADFLKTAFVTSAAMLAVCLLALVETTNAAEAKDSLPENGKIAYSDGATSIYVMDADGTGRTNVAPNTASPSTNVTPVWSPDGTKIAFSSNMRICVMDADGSHLRCLTDNSTDDTSPAWSPDGIKIAYLCYGETGHEICTVNADGSDQTRLTNNPERDEDINSSGDLTRWRDNLDPVWSPDGKKIAFGVDSKPPSSSGIYMMNPDGSDQSLVITGGDQPDWSPDGSKIAYRGEYSAQGYADIYVANADGSNPANLTGRIGDVSVEHAPAWSPDGTKIVFQRDQNEKGRSGIYAIDADGRNLRRLTNIPVTDASPDWQPLPGTTPSKDADGSDVAKGTKEPAAEDEDRHRPERSVIVKLGDSLWSISEERLGPEASPQRVYEHTYRMYALNRKIIGSDPDLIYVGQRLSLPPLGEG